ncbi:MAG: hypothetical protein J6T10_04685 [Methanobrevibacter sp.]|nr:hypothetical protein [Methanobrevibacter sp.]
MSETTNKDLDKSLDIVKISEAQQLDGVKITADIVKTKDFQTNYTSLVNLIDYLNSIKKSVDSGVKELVKNNYTETGDSSITTDDYNFTYVPESTRQTIDSKKFKQEHPELYVKYTTTNRVSDSIRITKVKKDEEDSKKSIDAVFSEVKSGE